MNLYVCVQLHTERGVLARSSRSITLRGLVLAEFLDSMDWPGKTMLLVGTPCLYHRVALDHLAEDHVGTIQVARSDRAKEELASIGVLASRVK